MTISCPSTTLQCIGSIACQAGNLNQRTADQRLKRLTIAQGSFSPGQGPQWQGPSGRESFKLKNAFAFFPARGRENQCARAPWSAVQVLSDNESGSRGIISSHSLPDLHLIALLGASAPRAIENTGLGLFLNKVTAQSM